MYVPAKKQVTEDYKYHELHKFINRQTYWEGQYILVGSKTILKNKKIKQIPTQRLPIMGKRKKKGHGLEMTHSEMFKSWECSISCIHFFTLSKTVHKCFINT